MYGVIDGVYFCNQQRANELNERISERNIPSHALEPAFSVRPVATKYTIMPIVDQIPKSDISLKNFPKYNLEKVFNPGNSQAPWSGFASQINTESTLRNQFFALQKCDQAKYIPSSNSSLYQTHMPPATTPSQHSELFNENNFKAFNPNPQIGVVGKNIFNNNTRVQVKNIEC
jgi:hypothetical protein